MCPGEIPPRGPRVGVGCSASAGRAPRKPEGLKIGHEVYPLHQREQLYLQVGTSPSPPSPTPQEQSTSSSLSCHSAALPFRDILVGSTNIIDQASRSFGLQACFWACQVKANLEGDPGCRPVLKSYYPRLPKVAERQAEPFACWEGPFLPRGY